MQHRLAPWAHRLRALARVEWPPTTGPRPVRGRVALGALVALVGSLAADAVLVAIGEDLFPSTRHFVHFRPLDYGTLTVIGVLTACVAWPVVASICRTPRWLFLRLAILVSLVLLVPDLWILLGGASARAVAVLVVMHLSVAVVTYNVLVRLAPLQGASESPLPDSPAAAGTSMPGGARSADAGAFAVSSAAHRAPSEPRAVSRASWVGLIVLTCTELFVGLGALLYVPYSRPSVWVPGKGRPIYLLHAGLGALLALSAVAVLIKAWQAGRSQRMAALIGATGVAIGGLGGLLTVDRPLRLVGIGLMLVGVTVAGFAYLMPLIEDEGAGTGVLDEPSRISSEQPAWMPPISNGSERRPGQSCPSPSRHDGRGP